MAIADSKALHAEIMNVVDDHATARASRQLEQQIMDILDGYQITTMIRDDSGGSDNSRQLEVTMAEYIKRDDALRQVLLVETRENMFQCIKNLPAADVVVRKTGKWLKVNGYAIALTSDDEQITMPTHKCSACGKPSLNVFYTNFCPNCGAKMIGGDDDV